MVRCYEYVYRGVLSQLTYVSERWYMRRMVIGVTRSPTPFSINVSPVRELISRTAQCIKFL